MATELTEEQKIIIGVCVGVAGLILVAIIIFVCWIFYSKDKRRRRRNGYKEKLVVDRYDRNPYPVYEKHVPTVFYDPPSPPPPPPPPPPMWREQYYRKPRSVEPLAVRYDSWDRRHTPPRKYYSDNRWEGQYRRDPIVVPLAEPEYTSSNVIRKEPDTIYLKYVEDTPWKRYSGDYGRRYSADYGQIDDMALLPRTNYVRRTDYGNYGHLRRTRSFGDMRRATAFVGDWGGRRDNLYDFNEHALRAGRDPFLWK